MDWKMQLGISIGVPIFTSLLTYLAAIKKSNNDIKSIQIQSDTEIKKIKEDSDKELKKIEAEYNNQIKKMKAETDEQIKLKLAEHELNLKENDKKATNELAMKFFDNLMKNPQEGTKQLKNLQDIAETLKSQDNS